MKINKFLKLKDQSKIQVCTNCIYDERVEEIKFDKRFS